jgi:hypothetical protein
MILTGANYFIGTGEKARGCLSQKEEEKEEERYRG